VTIAQPGCAGFSTSRYGRAEAEGLDAPIGGSLAGAEVKDWFMPAVF
jgi:hypothetical protein